MFPSAPLSCVLIILQSFLFLAAWSAGNPVDISFPKSDIEVELQPEERETEEHLEQEASSSDEGSEEESDEDFMRIQKVVKQILSKSVDLKTVILAKDSIFNFFPSGLKVFITGGSAAEADVGVKSETTNADDDEGSGVESVEHHVTPVVSTATADENSVATDEIILSTEQQCNDVTGSVELSNDVTGSVEPSNDVTEAPTLGSETTWVDIVSQSEATLDVTTSEATYSVSESQSSAIEGNGAEAVTEGIANDYQIQVTYPIRDESATSSDGNETASQEELIPERMEESKYVYIRSLLPPKKLEVDVPNYLVLDVDFEDKSAEDESRRIVLSHNDQALSEQWLIDNETHAIRNRLKKLCIDFNERHQLIANPCNETSVRQMWLYSHIHRSLHNPYYNYVAAVVTPEAEIGGNVKVEAYDGHLKQHFVLGTLPLYFVLENEQTGLALSVLEDRDRPGTKLILSPLANPPTNGQLWYLDSKKVLRSKLNDYVIDGSSGIFLAEPFTYEAFYSTSWTYYDRQIINLNDERMVMEPVSNEFTEELVLIPTRRQQDRVEQKFKIVYTTPNEIVTPANIVTSLPTSKEEHRITNE